MKILVLGGNRFFGKKLVGHLLDNGMEVTLANRGKLDDGFQSKVARIKVDRTSLEEMKSNLGHLNFDVVYDQIGFMGNDASIAIKTFEGNIGKLIFTSTLSVYSQFGKNLKESDVPKPIVKPSTPGELYGYGKQESEKIYLNSSIPTTFVRFPYVLGLDDYTKRLGFHIQRVFNDEPIYFQNIHTHFAPINSDDAAKALFYLLKIKVTGPINVSPKLPIQLSEMMSWIEESTNKKAIYSNVADPRLTSPYNGTEDWWMNVEKMEQLGFSCSPIIDWLPSLIEKTHKTLK